MKAASVTMRLTFANRALPWRRAHAALADSCLLFFTALSLPAQDFGFDDDAGGGAFGGTGNSALAVSIGGDASVNDFTDGAEAVRLGNIFSGKLNVSAETSRASGVINLKLAPGTVYYDEKSPVSVDEIYIHA
jgi:hypothetical protein